MFYTCNTRFVVIRNFKFFLGFRVKNKAGFSLVAGARRARAASSPRARVGRGPAWMRPGERDARSARRAGDGGARGGGWGHHDSPYDCATGLRVPVSHRASPSPPPSLSLSPVPVAARGRPVPAVGVGSGELPAWAERDDGENHSRARSCLGLV